MVKVEQHTLFTDVERHGPGATISVRDLKAKTPLVGLGTLIVDGTPLVDEITILNGEIYKTDVHGVTRPASEDDVLYFEQAVITDDNSEIADISIKTPFFEASSREDLQEKLLSFIDGDDRFSGAKAYGVYLQGTASTKMRSVDSRRIVEQTGMPAQNLQETVATQEILYDGKSVSGLFRFAGIFVSEEAGLAPEKNPSHLGLHIHGLGVEDGSRALKDSFDYGGHILDLENFKGRARIYPIEDVSDTGWHVYENGLPKTSP